MLPFGKRPLPVSSHMTRLRSSSRTAVLAAISVLLLAGAAPAQDQRGSGNFLDNLFNNTNNTQQEPSNLSAIKIGFFQCIAMMPGVSRSAATIIGGLTQKLSKTAAAEFSFFLAVPTMFAATAYKLLKYYKAGNGFSSQEISILAVGNVVAFIVAMLSIRWLIYSISKYGFKFFGYYRIALGIIILILVYSGASLSIF